MLRSPRQGNSGCVGLELTRTDRPTGRGELGLGMTLRGSCVGRLRSKPVRGWRDKPHTSLPSVGLRGMPVEETTGTL